MDRAGGAVLGNRDAASGIRLTPAQSLERLSKEERMSEERITGDASEKAEMASNTTLTLVVTNREMSQVQLQRLAIETHTSMARGIQPFHTSRDGDTLFAVSTGEEQASDADIAELCLSASDLAWTAILNCTNGGQA
jgi:L-aminopeptidase/D-esterase-like protein